VTRLVRSLLNVGSGSTLRRRASLSVTIAEKAIPSHIPMSVASAPRSFDDLTPRQDATTRLLLLLSKVKLTESQENEVGVLAGQVRDWEEFTRIATNKFAVTFAHRHLQACAAGIVPTLAMEQMRKLARATALSVLRIAAAQAAFHRTCIQPANARHAYLKGIALALQYSRRLGDRYCRDIDILVASKDFGSVVDTAIASGYRVVLDGEGGQFAETPQDLRFLSKHADVVTLVGPDSVPIEVHRRLDKLSLNFDVEFALTTAEEVALPGVTVKVLSKPLHFVYLCYHHSRHFWSHLHWLADLDGMLTSPYCDRERILALADTVGIRPTIEAAFEFHDLVSRPGLWGEAVPAETGGGQFLKACLVNLDGGLDLETELRKGMTLSDFMSPWQLSPGRYGKFWFNSWMRRLRPSVSQYVAHRHPPHLQWIYSLENAAALTKNGLALAFGAAAGGAPGKLRRRSSSRANDPH
jgi:hypothetical protein